MYKLLIADDEPLERQALRYFVENSSLEISQVIECANGLEALSQAMVHHPEICILDVKMPGLSGHEVLEQIKAANRDCKVILSTAYSYFSYALKALQLGAFDFMVKPVHKDVVVRTVNKAIDQLDEERSQLEETRRLSDAAHLLERRILGQLVRGEVDEEVLWFLDAGSSGQAGSGCSYFVRVDPGLGEQRGQLEAALRRDLLDVGFRYLLAIEDSAISLLLFSQHQGALASMAETLKTILENCFFGLSIQYRLGQGSWFGDLEQVEHSYALARASMGDLLLDEAPPANAAPSPETPPSSSQRAPLEEAPPEIHKLCEYIRDNYSEKLTLDILARKVGFSKFYISRLFKQYTGSTIIDYLIAVRMDRAKELLENSGQSIKQISYAIGYSDPNYFTWSFKKYEGMSPVKYRYHEGEKFPSGEGMT